jgi:hypothetical protein
MLAREIDQLFWVVQEEVEKSPSLNWATQFSTVPYFGAFSVMFLSEWCEFPSAPYLAGKKP